MKKNYADGKIKNREYQQITDFSNLVFKLPNTTISPTDIDGFMEFQGIVAFIIELKYGDNDIVPAQEYTFKNVSKAMLLGGYEGVYTIVANHNTPIGNDIDAGNATIKKVWDGTKWITPPKPIKVRTFIKNALKFHNIT